jgi:hypothetical protein
MTTIRSRRAALAILAGSALFGLAGCQNENEKDFAKTPGSAPPDAPQTAEEYELKRHPQKPETP